MSENNTGSVQRCVTVKLETASPAPTICFIFANLSFLFWANMLGLLGEGAELAIGCVQLGVFVIYVACGLILNKQGAAFDSNVFMIFAAFFGGVGSLLSIGGSLARLFAVPFSNSVSGLCWLVCGLFVLGIAPGARKSPLVAFLFYIFGGTGLTALGLQILGILGAAWIPFAAWLMFSAGACGIWVSLATMNGFEGLHIPLGRPLFR